MCRKILFYAGILIAFGIGLLFSVLFESGFIRFVIGGCAIAGGFFLLRR